MIDNEDVPLVRKSCEDVSLGFPVGSKTIMSSLRRATGHARHPGFPLQMWLSPQPLRRKERPLAACELPSPSSSGSELLAL